MIPTLNEVLFQCLRHFVYLDESNAAIHCAPVRYSPITFRVAEHLRLLNMDIEEDESDISPEVSQLVDTVLDHVGQYEEDTGR